MIIAFAIIGCTFVYLVTLYAVCKNNEKTLQTQKEYNRAREDSLYEALEAVVEVLPTLKSQLEEIKENFDKVKQMVERSNDAWKSL